MDGQHHTHPVLIEAYSSVVKTTGPSQETVPWRITIIYASKILLKYPSKNYEVNESRRFLRNIQKKMLEEYGVEEKFIIYRLRW